MYILLTLKPVAKVMEFRKRVGFRYGIIPCISLAFYQIVLLCNSRVVPPNITVYASIRVTSVASRVVRIRLNKE